MNALAIREETLGCHQPPPTRNEFICPRPAAQGRHAPSLTNRGSSSAEAPPLRALPPARSCHGVRARPATLPLRPRRSLRRLSSPRPSASPLTRSASGGGLSQPPALTRGLLHVHLFRRARPPRHALAAAPAPCALGHPRLRFPGCPRRRMASPGSRRGHTRGSAARRPPPGTACPKPCPNTRKRCRAATGEPAPSTEAAEAITDRNASGPPRSRRMRLHSSRQAQRHRLACTRDMRRRPPATKPATFPATQERRPTPPARHRRPTSGPRSRSGGSGTRQPPDRRQARPHVRTTSSSHR